MIELKNISFSYESGREVLKDVSFTLSDGEMDELTAIDRDERFADY